MVNQNNANDKNQRPGGTPLSPIHGQCSIPNDNHASDIFLSPKQYYRVSVEIAQWAHSANIKSANHKGQHKYGIADSLVYSVLFERFCFYFSQDQLKDGWFYQSIRQLSKATGLSLKRVHIALRLLSRHQGNCIEVRKGNASVGEANWYKIVNAELEPRYTKTIGSKCKNMNYKKTCNYCSYFIECQKKKLLIYIPGNKIFAPIRNKYITIPPRIVKTLGINAAAIYGVLKGQQITNLKKSKHDAQKSISKLSNLLMLKPDTVISNLKKLESKGLIVISRKMRGNCNTYKTNPINKVIPVSKSNDATPIQPQPCSNMDTGLVHGTTPIQPRGSPIQKHIINKTSKYTDSKTLNTHIEIVKCGQEEMAACEDIFLFEEQNQKPSICEVSCFDKCNSNEGSVFGNGFGGYGWTIAKLRSEGMADADIKSLVAEQQQQLQFGIVHDLVRIFSMSYACPREEVENDK